MFLAKKKLFSSFIFLNLTQFFSALNDNIYKLLLVFFLINIKGAEHSNTILALAGAVFVIPFILFASLVGSIADRFSKRSVIYFTRLLEILTTLLGTAAFAFHSAFGSYAVLFLMATHSAIFSPCKYGIIPEIVKKEKISHCNGVMTATTYLAIILGTFLASFLTEITQRNFILAVSFCVVVSVLGALTSLGIEKTVPQAARKKVSARFISEIISTLRRALKTRYLLSTIVFGAYFLFMGAYTQLNIIPFTLQSLRMSEILGGYLFLMTAIGIGIGSFLAGRLSGKEIELGFVPLAAIGVTICYLSLYFFASHFYIVAATLILVGIFGGIYIIPIDAFIQVASPNEDRGQNVAAGNFLNFIGVIIASLLLAFFGNVLGFSAAEGFAIVGILTFIMGILLLFTMADQVLRLLVSVVARFFWKLKVVGKRHMHMNGPVLFVCQRTAWIDTLIVMATLPRMMRYIVPIGENSNRSFLYHLIQLIPIDMKHFSQIGAPALKEIRKELEMGQSICLMHPVDIATSTMNEWKEKLAELLQDIHVPTVPIYVTRKPAPSKGWFKQVKTLFNQPIKIAYGHQIKF